MDSTRKILRGNDLEQVLFSFQGACCFCLCWCDDERIRNEAQGWMSRWGCAEKMWQPRCGWADEVTCEVVAAQDVSKSHLWALFVRIKILLLPAPARPTFAKEAKVGHPRLWLFRQRGPAPSGKGGPAPISVPFVERRILRKDQNPSLPAASRPTFAKEAKVGHPRLWLLRQRWASPPSA